MEIAFRSSLPDTPRRNNKSERKASQLRSVRQRPPESATIADIDRHISARTSRLAHAAAGGYMSGAEVVVLPVELAPARPQFALRHTPAWKKGEAPFGAEQIVYLTARVIVHCLHESKRRGTCHVSDEECFCCTRHNRTPSGPTGNGRESVLAPQCVVNRRQRTYCRRPECGHPCLNWNFCGRSGVYNFRLKPPPPSNQPVIGA
jgi:hypothetical protein